MAVVPVYNGFHKVLRNKTNPVKEINDDIKQLVQNLFDTLYNIDNGVGLAANQIGVDKSVVVIDTSLNGTEEGEKIIMINPEILEMSEETCQYDEGCLSVPELYEPVTRPEKIKIKYFDLDLKEHIEDVDDFLARVMLHEIDHLNGIVFFERLSGLRKTMAKSKLNKLAKGKIIPAYDMVQADGTFTEGIPED